MDLTLTRVRVLMLAATLAAPAAPVAAQARGQAEPARSQAELQDLRAFVNSVSVRRNARVCERGVTGFGETFRDLYKAWSVRHRGELARGEAVFKDALTQKTPGTNQASLVRIEASLAELAKPPQATEAIKLDARTTAACDKVLNYLKTD